MSEDVKYVKIFDTTLRDGEQSPGASMSEEAKLKFALQLEKLGVDIIEAGFPISSPAQFRAVQMIADEVRKPVIAGLARALEGDIKSAYDALKNAEKPRIHTFIATSPIHMEYKLRKKPDEVLKMAVEAVKYAKSLVEDVEFSAEDATRSDPKFLAEIFSAVIEAGATTINVPDTVGYTVPEEFYNLITYLKENVKGIDGVTISVHCHNDLGLATANSLAAVLAGATQVECTVNGLGERAGNASMEEIVMAIKVRKDVFKAETGINTKEIYRTSRLLVALSGVPVQPNKAIVGKNAFAHESGIHQDGVIKQRQTYEIMSPDDIGRPSSELVLGRHSGRRGVKTRLEELGYYLTDDEFKVLFDKFMGLADKKKSVYDDDLITLVEDVLGKETEGIYKLEHVQVISGDDLIPTATVVMRKDSRTYREASTGNGPIDAVYKAIDRVVKMPVALEDYSVNSITSGKDALGEASVTVRDKETGEMVSGHAASTDIITASAKAYLSALNKMIKMKERKKNDGEVEAHL